MTQPFEIELQDCVLNAATPKTPVSGRVKVSRIATKSKKSAGFIRHVEIDITGTPLAGKMVAGQSFGIIPPGATGEGKPHKLRLYSCSSPTCGEDGQGNVIATCCKRVVDEHWDTHRLFTGVCSNYVCDLQEGDEVLVTGPSGKRFLLPKNPGDFNYIFISTGTGIAPFRGMAIDLLKSKIDMPVTLISGSPYTTDLLYDDEFQALAKTHDNFKYITAISREKQEDVPSKLYVDGRLKANADWFVPMLEKDNTLIYICGLAGMELGIFQRLAELLSPEHLAKYIQGDESVMADPTAWKAVDIGRAVKRTERVFAEVY